MRLFIWLVVLAIEIPLLFGIGRLLFRRWRSFWDAMEALFVLDLSAALSGEEHYKPGKLELLLLVVFAIISTLALYYLVARYLFGLPDPWG